MQFRLCHQKSAAFLRYGMQLGKNLSWFGTSWAIQKSQDKKSYPNCNIQMILTCQYRPDAV